MSRILRISLFAISAAVFSVGCQNTNNNQLEEKLNSLEKRVAELEKRPAAPRRPSAPPSQETAYKLPIGESHVLGEKDAKVTITVFSDYQCPYCARVDPMLAELVADDDLKGKVNVVFKHFPLSFHKNAKPASKAAMAAGEQGSDKFWAMSEKMFKNQSMLTQDNFDKWAKEIGLDVEKFKKDLKDNDKKYEDAIRADTELGMKEAQVRGTPSLYVGGWELRQRSVEGVKNLIKDKNLL